MYTIIHKPQLLIPGSTASVFIKVGDKEEYVILASFKHIDIEEGKVSLSNGYINLEPFKDIDKDTNLEYLLELEDDLLPCNFISTSLKREGALLIAESMELELKQ